jgi:hypothetical protein
VSRFAVAIALLLIAAELHAQSPSARDRAEARALFERGKEAMNEGRFAEARELFERSLERAPRASVAFNLAASLRGMGRPKASHDLLRRMLAGKFGELPPEKRAQVEELARETRRDIAKLTVVARGATDIELSVDGVRVTKLKPGQPFTLEVDPGERVIGLSAKLHQPVERRVMLAPGESERVSATLALSRAARRATLVVIATKDSHEVEIQGVGKARGRIERRLDPGRYVVRLHAPEGEREREVLLEPATSHRVELEPPASGVLASPWFWTGAGVLAVGAVVGGYFLFSDRERDPVTDSEFQRVETLRWH